MYLVDHHWYLAVRSQKYFTDTLIKLPAYCREIIQKYKKSRRFGQAILPHFNASNLNQYIKQLLEKAGFVQEVRVTRTQGGKQIESNPPSKYTLLRLM